MPDQPQLLCVDVTKGNQYLFINLAKKRWHSQAPSLDFFEIPLPLAKSLSERRDVRLYGDVITKLSRLDGLPIVLTHGSLSDHFENNRFVSQSNAVSRDVS